MTKPIAVLGSGPAGLMAAWACVLAERPFVIFSEGKKSRLGGAQYLHEPIIGLNDPKEPKAILEYKLRGDVETYQRKAYGDQMLPYPSWGIDSPIQPAWPLIDTYEELWHHFGENVETNVARIDPFWVRGAIESGDFSMIFSTIPLPSICLAVHGMIGEFHRFHHQTIHIYPECLEEVEDNTIIYEGTKERSWYRTSRIFGVGGTEWGDQARRPPGYKPMYKDDKPISTTCDCWAGEVYRMGRKGTWDKAAHVHHSFLAALEALGKPQWMP